MLVHILHCVFDGKERRGLILGRALLVQLIENLIKYGHTFMIVAGMLAIPSLIDGLEGLCKHRGISGNKKLRIRQNRSAGV